MCSLIVLRTKKSLRMNLVFDVYFAAWKRLDLKINQALEFVENNHNLRDIKEKDACVGDWL